MALLLVVRLCRNLVNERRQAEPGPLFTRCLRKEIQFGEVFSQAGRDKLGAPRP
jgi:hypothetical protein